MRIPVFLTILSAGSTPDLQRLNEKPVQPAEENTTAAPAPASAPVPAGEVDDLCINAIRILSMDAVERAQCGHPGAPMGLAAVGYVLWTRHLKHNPRNPAWFDRDRFVLSCGHASMLLYSLLYLSGYELSLDDIKNFRQWDSITPGHPEFGLTPGVETTSGPLGQGFSNAVGMALAEARLAAEVNRPGFGVVDHHTYVLVSDGDLMEGLSHEAASLAGHLGLGKLIGFYDNNGITIDGPTSLAFSENVAARFEAYGWHVCRVADGNDVEAINDAIVESKNITDRPSLIIVSTHIGYGSPGKQDSADAHGAPLGADEIEQTRANLGWNYSEPFELPEEAVSHWRRCVKRGAEAERQHSELCAGFRSKYEKEANELTRRFARELPKNWQDVLPSFSHDNGSIATRAASGAVINSLANVIPELIGGSADLSGSNNTVVKGAEHLTRKNYAAQNIHFGVREHAMGGVLSGMALHGGFIPYGGTFLIFSDYMRPSIRLAAMMRQHVIYVFTHDSIGLGEDGPTHQPVEHLTALRVIPGLLVLRPSDAGETVEAWRLALEHSGPVALVLTRQKVPFVDRTKYAAASGLAKGGYILADCDGVPAVVLIATGSEVQIALGARAQLSDEGVNARVVSMPSIELFGTQDEAYRTSVLPDGVPRVAVEAAHTMSWASVVGQNGRIVGINHFGASAPFDRLYQEFGITEASVVEAAKQLVEG